MWNDSTVRIPMGGLTPAPGNPISDLPLKKMTAKIFEFENPIIIRDKIHLRPITVLFSLVSKDTMI